MAQTTQESLSAPPAESLADAVAEDILALAALDAELDARQFAASEGAKQRLNAHLEAAKHTSGGRMYELGGVVDRGHITRGAGSSAVAGSFGMSQKPYAMPYMRSRKQITDPYINRGAVRY